MSIAVENAPIMECDIPKDQLRAPPKTLEELCARLDVALSGESADADAVQFLMESYKSTKADWAKYAHFAPHRYTRNLVSEGNGKYNLMVLCWAEGQASSIHDHANAHCFMKVLDGECDEALYEWSEVNSEHEMHPKRILRYKKDQVAYIHDKIGIHRVENPSHTKKCVTLHLYSPPYQSCHAFDERTGKQRACGNITFFSKGGVRVQY
eukprot:Colp12_sorted_trinity150504_noHs@18502